jgi:pimeloyl-ACP methyl ester carboxylesterase
MKILFIHGANSTTRSFAYIRCALKVEHTAHFFEYDTHTPALINIAQCQQLVDEVRPDAIIGHSLGGVMAAYMTTDAKKITLASPFGGSAVANWLPMYSQLMRDVATTSPLIYGLRSKTVDGSKFLSIVANGLDGNGFDGVVSTISQTNLKGADYLIFDLNHMEVLLDESIVSIIENWLCPAASS